MYRTIWSMTAGWTGALWTSRGLSKNGPRLKRASGGLLALSLPRPSRKAVEIELNRTARKFWRDADFSDRVMPPTWRGTLNRYWTVGDVRIAALPVAIDQEVVSRPASPATPFRRKVWRCITRIPYGSTRSYQWVAAQIGQPGASRAVGQALKANPLPVVVPCHRVVTARGARGTWGATRLSSPKSRGAVPSSSGLGGFSGGLAWKKRLLALERNSV